MVGLSISIGPEAINKLESRMKATGKNRSEYLEALIIQDFMRSMNPQLEAGKTYASLIEDAERQLLELKAAEEQHKKEDARIRILNAWFDSHDQEWRETIIERFMNGRAIFAKSYWDVVKVQKLFEERYKSSAFFWTKGLEDLEMRKLIEDAFKEEE